MATPLYATPEMIETIKVELDKKVSEFKDKLSKGTLDNGTIEFKQAYKWPDKSYEKPVIEFSPEAWIKMTSLVATTASEIAWNGKVDRVSDTHFIITDILVYPQSPSSAFVDMEEADRSEWLSKIPFEERLKLRFQGHSHVDMSPSPSTTDMKCREKIISQIRTKEDFYIFIIINKSYKYTVALYDMKTNGVYTNDDLTVKIPVSEDKELFDWISDEKKNINNKSTAYTSVPKNLITAQDTSPATKSKKSCEKKKEKNVGTVKNQNLTRGQLHITADDIHDQGSSWYNAYAILNILLDEVNNDAIENTREALMHEVQYILTNEMGYDDFSGYESYGYGSHGRYYGYGDFYNR